MEQSIGAPSVTPAAARQELNGGHPARALEIAKSGIKAAPKDRRFLLIAAEACAKLGRHVDRIGYLRSIVTLHPEDERGWFRLATTIGRTEGPEKAVDEVRRAYEQRPSEGLRSLLSDCYRKAQRFDDAIALWTDRKNVQHLLRTADVLLEARNYDVAEKTYRAALAQDDGNVEALKGLARVSQYVLDFPRAVERWATVLAKVAQDPGAKIHLASVLRMNGSIVQAEECIQEAMVLCEAAQPARFWGSDGKPHPNATTKPLVERTRQALNDQAKYLVVPGSPYHPSRPSTFDAALEREWSGQESLALQYSNEAKFLTLFLAENRIKSFFEVGLRHGAFSQLLDGMLKFERIGGSEFVVTPKLQKLMEDKRYKIFAGDHHGAEYRKWRENQEPYDFVFIDGGHSYNDAMRDYLRERALRPRFIGFHDVWNIACLGAKRMWDELPGKLVYYCNTDPSQYLFIANRRKNYETNYLNVQRESNGYCCGIGIIELER